MNLELGAKKTEQDDQPRQSKSNQYDNRPTKTTNKMQKL